MGIVQPEAMTLATSTRSGAPSARMVLLKSFDSRGLVFYSNYESRKGQELQENPQGALVLYWQPLGWQIRIEGSVERLSRSESWEYFRTRPLQSRIAARVSPQSEVIEDYGALVAEFDKTRSESYEDPTLPPFWGGYRLLPQAFEFWIAEPNRMHRRTRYRRHDRGWAREFLAP